MGFEMAKEVAIITIHFGTNHGSVLQAYALSNYLESIGCRAKIIDYVPERYKIWNSLVLRRGKQYPLPVLLAYYPITVMKSIRVRRLFGRFVKRNLNLTRRYSTKEELCQAPPKADMYITGSDQVWNNDYNGDSDCSYFLDFVSNDAKRVAYAASFGKEEVSEAEYLGRIKPLLQRFDVISVREIDAQNILEKMGINAMHVVDPVFLFTKQQWTEFGTETTKIEPYILVYVMDGIYGELLDYAQKIKEQTGNKIYVVSFKKIEDKRVDKCFYLANPKDFVGLISKADAVVTNSFHGTAFSVLFQKNFITIGKTKYNSRMLSLLEKMELRKHFIPTGENYELERIINALERRDIDQAEKKLQRWIAESKDFIQKAVEI